MHTGQPGVLQRWTCACGRTGMALALDACPACGEPRPGTGEGQAAAPQARKPRRTAKGGQQ